MPCTMILVGKKASYDGSTIIARNEDSSNGVFGAKKFQVVRPEDQPKHYKAVISHVEIDLSDLEPMRYTSVPDAIGKDGIWGEAGVNEANVAMSATETITTNARVLGADPYVKYQPAKGKPGEEGYVPEQAGGIGEEDLVTLVLPYIHSAREGVQRLGKLLETYGTYEANAIAFSDVDEIWELDSIGGHHWIARRVPDESYVTMPNQLGIDAFDLDDALGEQVVCMCTPDLASFLDDNHLDLTYLPEDDDDPFFTQDTDAAADDLEEDHRIFNPRHAFGSITDDGDRVYNTPRAWAMQRYLNPTSNTFDGIDADLRPMDDDIPWARVPERKVTIEDVKYVLGLHYQGTPYDPYGAFGDPRERGQFRPIGINRNGELAIMQLRPYAPEATRALQWLTYGSNPFNAIVPFYVDIDTTPEYLSNTTARVTTDSYYWENRIIAALADAHFRSCFNDIADYQLQVPAAAYRIVAETDAAVSEKGLSYEDARETLESANEKIASMLQEKTDKLLDQVLYTASMEMKNGFAMSDSVSHS